jgi:hypothetical protein
VDPDDPDLWFVSAARGPSEAHSGTYGGNHQANAQIYRWRGAGPWKPLTALTESKTSMPYALSISNGQLYAGLANGSIFVSGDHGDTWQAIKTTGAEIKTISALVAVS